MDSGQSQRGVKRKRSQTSDRKERSESNSVGSNRSPMAQEWKDKYTSIYLNLLRNAMIGNFPRHKGNLYDFDFWEAFNIEFNRLIPTKFPTDTFSGFTIKNVITIGRGLEACYIRHKDNPCHLENFADYDLCFNKLCNNSPVFPHFEAHISTSASTSSLDMSRATTSGNGRHLEIVALRLSSLVNEGILDPRKCPKVLEHFLRNEGLALTWINVKGDSNQMAFLDNM